MNLFLILYIILVAFIVIRSHNKVLCNPFFWIICFWALIVGVYLSSGVNFGKYTLSPFLILFLALCSIALYSGNRAGYKKKITYSGNSKEHSHFLLISLGLLGIVLFLYDIFSLNGLFVFFGGVGLKVEYETSIIGSIGVLLIPILLVEGLYLIADGLKNKNRFSILGLALLLAYSVPCMINNGRESLLYVVIGIIVLYGYKSFFYVKTKRKFSYKQLFPRVVIIGGLIFLGWIIVDISKGRFGENEIQVFLAENPVDSKTMDEARSWGNYEFLYYNIMSYFSHQISFLDFTLKEYNGPHMFGVYELNIISRRLPESLGLDYKLVHAELNRLFSSKGVPFSGAWNTMLGSFIIDFGRIGAILACYLCGYAIGRVRKKFKTTLELKYAVLVALICLSAFSTVQLGPFYQIMIYGSYVWWIIIYGNIFKRRIQIINRHDENFENNNSY